MTANQLSIENPRSGTAGPRTQPAMEAMASNADIIPVGREPERVDGPNESRALHENNTRKDGAGGTHERALSNKSSRSPIRDPERFYKYKNALEESRVFREFTMRALKRRAELAVWLAIHGCQHCGRAQISQKRIAELAGIKGKRHVVNAIQGLSKKGLLEVVVKGHYRPNGVEEHGLSSVYRVYPRPEPRLLEKVRAEEQEEPGPIAGKDMGDFEKRSPK